jgi:hypothetical protein
MSAGRCKLLTQLGVIVDFPIESDDELSIRRHHGLVSRRSEVNYGKATVSQAYVCVAPDAGIIRATLAQTVHAAFEYLQVGQSPFGMKHTNDSAH